MFLRVNLAINNSIDGYSCWFFLVKRHDSLGPGAIGRWLLHPSFGGKRAGLACICHRPKPFDKHGMLTH